jgi:uncharacterized spore protein YtfJ
MKIEQIIEEATNAIGSRRVFGEPYEKNGVTIIPAARVMGGVGGGDGQAAAVGTDRHSGDPPGGAGAGYGMIGSPAGAFVVRGDDVRWVPAVDVNRMMLGMQVVLIALFLVVRSVMKARARAVAP